MIEDHGAILGYEDDGTPVINCPVCDGCCFVELESRPGEEFICPECLGNGDIQMPTIQ